MLCYLLAAGARRASETLHTLTRRLPHADCHTVRLTALPLPACLARQDSLAASLALEVERRRPNHSGDAPMSPTILLLLLLAMHPDKD